MFARRMSQLAVAAMTAGAAVGFAGPAAAAVRYDPVAKSGFADAADVRKVFGWDEATLMARAAGLSFQHGFWTRDTFTVWCGKGPFPVSQQREYGRFELTNVAVREPRRGARGYSRSPRLEGFKIVGPYAGISGTSVPPAVGQPCPQPGGPRITRAELVSTTTGWSLDVTSGTASRVLRTGR